jgi:hypothetical protein
MLAAQTMTGRDGNTAYALDGARLKDILTRSGGWPSEQLSQ